MVRYVVIEQRQNNRVQYGIAAYDSTTVVISLNDIAETYEETLRLSVMLQEHGVSAEHFSDIIEDYLARE